MFAIGFQIFNCNAVVFDTVLIVTHGLNSVDLHGQMTEHFSGLGRQVWISTSSMQFLRAKESVAIRVDRRKIARFPGPITGSYAVASIPALVHFQSTEFA